jgi:DNA repair exonuclease SbcCD nuclease subunit
MSEFQFIHAADLHLGAPFVGLHQDNPRLARMADDATYAAFDKIVELAIARKVLFVLFSGDIYDADYPNLKAQLRFRDGVAQLDKAGIQSCVIRGNHDHGGGERAKLAFPAGYYEFAPGANEPHYMFQNESPVAAIYGYSYPRRAVTENILRHYKPRAEDEKYFRIGMLHGNVGGDAEHDNYAPCSVTELKAIDIHYWALGHVHQAKVLSQAPPVVYPGTPQGLSIRETGAHGCYLVTVNDRHRHLEFIPADTLRWANISCGIEEMDGVDALLQKLETALENLAQREQHTVIARADLTGRGMLHGALNKVETLDTLREQLNERLTEVWLDRLQNWTRPDIDLEKKRHENNLLGDYLRLCRDAKDDKELQEKVLSALGEVCDHAVIKTALDIRGQAEGEAWLAKQLPQWLELAEIQGADLLLGEDTNG